MSGAIGETMPTRVAAARASSSPTSDSTLMATVLIDSASAVRTRTGPRNSSFS